ncbi:hypothetical protein K458DRAFT_490761 [Lentithecium fluviatile CBS 122367]|uniref:Polynucleotide 5'-hydroxyl-kinase GRC3 n=1 Tax=Lentithecium fluviatile CBS 122367 TaxID=1168545 RepID=A0A6G1IM98_9PLEO|nr:hypothetical protein K458DRAFT_490761 [Lentithecium fluviatile CBS 122367]
MAGKRKRGEVESTVPQTSDPANANGKPISAIAAARLKAAAVTAQATTIDGTQEAPQTLTGATDSDYAESEPDEIPVVNQNFKLSTWQNDGENVLSGNDEGLTIVLDKHSTAAFVGCCDVKILKGAVNVNGANLVAIPRQGEQARTYRVFVPSTHPISKVRGLDRLNHVQFLHCEKPTPFTRLSPLFADIWVAPSNSGKERSFHLISQSDTDTLARPLTPENAPEEWLRSIEDIASKSAISLVTGPPCSGKSTFAKRLLNRYLTGMGKTAKPLPSVCYLDLDPEKPEYTPHGQVSLIVVQEVNLGPSFTHPNSPPGVPGRNVTIAAHPIPFQSLANYEDYFTSCVSDLFQTYQNLPPEYRARPLIINTPTTLYTAHFALLRTLLTTVKPNHIIHLGDTAAIDPDVALKLDTLQTLAKRATATLHELAPQFPLLPPSRTDAELRTMHMQSYFHIGHVKPPNPHSKSPQGNMEIMWDTQPLSHLTPWEFCYEETTTRSRDLIGILAFFEPLPSSQLATALNGSVIHVVETSDPVTQAQYRTLPRTPDTNIPYFPSNASTGMTDPLDPQTSKLVCTAMIRGFDHKNRILQVLVPKTHDSLLQTLSPEKTVFVAGCCDTPEWAYVEDAYHQLHDQMSYLQCGGKFVGEDVLLEGVGLPPWVEKKSVVDGMGYLNTVRRVRKFLG